MQGNTLQRFDSAVADVEVVDVEEHGNRTDTKAQRDEGITKEEKGRLGRFALILASKGRH